MTATRPQPPRLQTRVLIVEDEPRLRELLQKALAGWGFETAVARSGEEAMRLAEADHPDILLLDLNLPGIDGLELLTRLREKLGGASGQALQPIVLTGFASVEAAKQAMHLDVVEFLTKPCHLGELEMALDRAVRRLPPPYPDAAGHAPSAEGMTLQEVERQHILAALERHNGNRSATAIELGISRRTLYYKLDEYQKQGYGVGGVGD